jgi:hypothetical protein
MFALFAFTVLGILFIRVIGDEQQRAWYLLPCL